MLAQSRNDIERGGLSGRAINNAFIEKLLRIKFQIPDSTPLTTEQKDHVDRLEFWASNNNYVLAVQTTTEQFGLGLYKPELAEFDELGLLTQLFECISDRDVTVDTFFAELKDLFAFEQECRRARRQQIVDASNRQFLEQFYRTKFYIADDIALTQAQQTEIDQLIVWAVANDIALGELHSETIASIVRLNADNTLTLEDFTKALKRILTINKLLIVATDTGRGAHAPILLKLLRNESARGVLGQEPDIQFILSGFVTNPSDIIAGGKYIMTPCNWGANVVRQVQNVLSHLEENSHIASTNENIELIMPVKSGGHWILVTISIENKKIVGLELSDSSGGPSETPIDQRNKTRSQFRSVLSGLFAELNQDSFAEHFSVNRISRNEQSGNSYCMDYTIQAALRKLGKVLYNSATGEDYYDLAYQSGSGARAEGLRASSVNVMQARLAGRPVALRDWQPDQVETCTKVFAESVAEAEKDSIFVKSFKFIGSGILDILWFIITLPFVLIKGAFDLGYTATTWLINAILPSKSIIPPKSAAPLAISPEMAAQPRVTAEDKQLWRRKKSAAGLPPPPFPKPISRQESTLVEGDRRVPVRPRPPRL